jgi:hypothetical protein
VARRGSGGGTPRQWRRAERGSTVAFNVMPLGDPCCNAFSPHATDTSSRLRYAQLAEL